MGAKIGVLLNCGQQSQFSKVRREFDAGRVNLDPPMTCADWPVPGNLTLLHTQTAYTRKPWHRDGQKLPKTVYGESVLTQIAKIKNDWKNKIKKIKIIGSIIGPAMAGPTGPFATALQ